MLFIVREDNHLALITERDLSYKAATSHSPAGTTTRLSEQKFKDNVLLLVAPFKQNSPERTHPRGDGNGGVEPSSRAAGTSSSSSSSCRGELLPGIHQRASICRK